MQSLQRMRGVGERQASEEGRSDAASGPVTHSSLQMVLYSSRRDLALLFLVQCTFYVSRVQLGLLFPRLPALFQEAGLDLSWVGFLLALNGVTSILGGSLSSYLSEKLGSYPTLCAVLILRALSNFCIIFSQDITTVSVLYILDGLGALDGLVTTYIFRRIRRERIAAYRARSAVLLTLGRSTGYLLFGVFGASDIRYSFIIGGSTKLLLAAVVLAALRVRNSTLAHRRRVQRRKGGGSSAGMDSVSAVEMTIVKDDDSGSTDSDAAVSSGREQIDAIAARRAARRQRGPQVRSMRLAPRGEEERIFDVGRDRRTSSVVIRHTESRLFGKSKMTPALMLSIVSVLMTSIARKAVSAYLLLVMPVLGGDSTVLASIVFTGTDVLYLVGQAVIAPRVVGRFSPATVLLFCITSSAAFGCLTSATTSILWLWAVSLAMVNLLTGPIKSSTAALLSFLQDSRVSWVTYALNSALQSLGNTTGTVIFQLIFVALGGSNLKLTLAPLNTALLVILLSLIIAYLPISVIVFKEIRIKSAAIAKLGKAAKSDDGTAGDAGDPSADVSVLNPLSDAAVSAAATPTSPKKPTSGGPHKLTKLRKPEDSLDRPTRSSSDSSSGSSGGGGGGGGSRRSGGSGSGTAGSAALTEAELLGGDSDDEQTPTDPLSPLSSVHLRAHDDGPTFVAPKSRVSSIASVGEWGEWDDDDSH